LLSFKLAQLKVLAVFLGTDHTTKVYRGAIESLNKEIQQDIAAASKSLRDHLHNGNVAVRDKVEEDVREISRITRLCHILIEHTDTHSHAPCDMVDRCHNLLRTCQVDLRDRIEGFLEGPSRLREPNIGPCLSKLAMIAGKTHSARSSSLSGLGWPTFSLPFVA